MSERIKSMKEFWPFYLGEHAQPKNRRLHIAGSYAAVAATSAAIATGIGWLPLAGVAVGYACAWVGHYRIEKNKPATFKYPLWSFASDLRMAGLWTMGKLKKEFNKYGIPHTPAKSSKPANKLKPKP